MNNQMETMRAMSFFQPGIGLVNSGLTPLFIGSAPTLLTKRLRRIRSVSLPA
jgi:hypothetical protein